VGKNGDEKEAVVDECRLKCFRCGLCADPMLTLSTVDVDDVDVAQTH